MCCVRNSRADIWRKGQNLFIFTGIIKFYPIPTAEILQLVKLLNCQDYSARFCLNSQWIVFCSEPPLLTYIPCHPFPHLSFVLYNSNRDDIRETGKVWTTFNPSFSCWNFHQETLLVKNLILQQHKLFFGQNKKVSQLYIDFK